MDTSLFSISLKNKKNFTQPEIDQLQHELTGFLSMFIDSFYMPPITTDDNTLEITFEENSRAKSLIENFLFHTKAYDKQYDLVFLADKVD